MLRSKDLNKEIEILELTLEKGDNKAVEKGMLKSNILLLKLLRDIKRNQVLSLKQAGVELDKPKIDNK